MDTNQKADTPGWIPIRRRTRLDGCGFSRDYLTRQKQVLGFQTGDLVKATVPKGKKAGVQVSRVAIRKKGGFNLQTANGVVQGIGYRHCRLILSNDEYNHSFNPIAQLQGEREKGHALRDALSLLGLNSGVSRTI